MLKHFRIEIFTFILFLLLGSLLIFILPDRGFSEQENRLLSSLPQLSIESVKSGKYMREFENYVSDQFPLRDKLVSLKAVSELSLGKTENNGVFFGTDGSLIDSYSTPDSAQLEDAVRSLSRLAENCEELRVPLYLALIPGAGTVQSGRLPANAPIGDQRDYIDSVYGQINPYIRSVDITKALSERKDDYIYFRTDHHWTALGAYYGYAETLTAMGLTPLALKPGHVLSNSFFGTAYSKSGASWVRPDTLEARVELYSAASLDYNSGVATPVSIYNPDRLSEKDKYAYFLGGNSPLRIIYTGFGGGKLLIIRDSYSDIETPYFLTHFSEIHLLDLRYYKGSVRDYIAESGITEVLVNYSAANFSAEGNLFLLGR
ncbi:MAG: hypothetical protein LBN97_07775 [Oscillospiraceae bacterium]|nr:hypothetical protein [Oscillospiraceae bacterium]